MIKPRPLPRGGVIGLTTPSSMTDAAVGALAQAEYRLRANGFTVKRAPATGARYGYLAGGDAARARALEALFLDDAVDAILCVRGGYGATRILDRLDYNAIARHPKLLCGFSDITALHLALQEKCGLVSVLGAMAASDLGRCDYEYATHQSFIDAMMNPEPSRVIRNPEDYAPSCALTGGTARGRLMGGNLALLCALLGTPYMPDFTGSILLLEDVGEAPYRVDRMLTQLRLAGVLDACAAIALGQFTDCAPARGADSLTLYEVFRDALPLGKKPIVSGLCFGHGTPRLSIPLYVTAELSADKGTITLLESPFSDPAQKQ